MDATQREMYERGAADAENDSLNSFYYQHYYYYRKGYNEVRRLMQRSPLRRAFAALLAVGAALLLGYAVVGAARGTLPTFIRAPLATRSTDAPAATDTLRVASLQVGQHANVVNTGTTSLRLRAAPRLDAEVVVRLDDGARVLLLDGPVPADGYIWWQVEHETGTGWGAEQGLDGVYWLQPAP